MGHAVPAAMGAKVGNPDAVVWAIDGDGCFQMTNQELATCAINNIPIKVALINNSSPGYGPAVADVVLRQALFQYRPAVPPVPGLREAGEAYGCYGLRASSREEVDVVIEKAMALNDAPVVIDFQVHRDAMVWPMVPAGTSNDLITTARDLAPAWERRTDDPPHTVRAGREQAGRARAHLRVVQPPRLQHRVAGGGSDREPRGQPDDDRHQRRPATLEQVTKQLNKLINVLKIVELDDEHSVQRELVLVKVKTDKGMRSNVLEIVTLFRAKVVDVAPRRP